MLEQLTPEQEELMYKVKEEWLQKYKTAAFDEERSKKWILWLYEFCGYPAPKILFASSPENMQEVYRSFKDPGDPEVAETSSYGNVSDFGWLGFYDFFSRIGITQHENFEAYKEFASCGMYDMIQADTHCIACVHPTEIRRDSEDRVHADMAPAMEWADGYKKYYLHGTEVPAELAMTDAQHLSVKLFHAEKNADVRTEFVRKFGMERLLDLGKTVDTYENYSPKSLGQETYDWYVKSKYALVDMANILEGVDYAPHLSMFHMTMGITCVEPVSPECKTVLDALNDRTEENTSDYNIMDIK